MARPKAQTGLAAALVAWTAVACGAEPAGPAAEPATGADPAPERPNIVVIYTDDQRFDSVAYMPALRALADEGVVFANSFVTAPVCGPSRSSLLTGKRIASLPVDRNEGASDQLDPRETIAVALQRQGYATALYGKYLNGYRKQFPAVPPGWTDWRALRDREDDLFGEGSLYVDPVLSWNGEPRRARGYSTELLTDYALEFIERHRQGPFFVLLSLWAPHVPLHPDAGHAGAWSGELPAQPPHVGEADMSDKPAWLRKRAAALGSTQGTPADWWRAWWPRYLETLASVDESVARIRARLETLGIARDTLLVFTSDNGFCVGEHWYVGKGVPYEESIRVPLVVWSPALEHRVVDAIALNIDLAPTFAELAGAPLEADGRSLVPWLRGASPRWRSGFEIEWRPPFGLPVPYRAYRSREFKVIEWDDGHREIYLLPTDPYEQFSLAPRAR